MPSLQQTDLRYPIGGPVRAESFTAAERQTAIQGIGRLPQELGSAIQGWTDERLDTPNRPEGWTVRQVVHHLADSHMNAYVRVRLALTEDWPMVVDYQEAMWAELIDARTAPVSASMGLLQGLHTRWVQLWSSLDEPQWKRGFEHPVRGRQTMEQTVMLYDWHCRHHTAHVTGLAARMSW